MGPEPDVGVPSCSRPSSQIDHDVCHLLVSCRLAGRPGRGCFYMTRCQIRVPFGGNEIQKIGPFFSAFFGQMKFLGSQYTLVWWDYDEISTKIYKLRRIFTYEAPKES